MWNTKKKKHFAEYLIYFVDLQILIIEGGSVLFLVKKKIEVLWNVNKT